MSDTKTTTIAQIRTLELNEIDHVVGGIHHPDGYVATPAIHHPDGYVATPAIHHPDGY
ncbi:hypothetical protein [Lichenicoccus roseus]|uniref:hypothetical protein n=1 Tax=Lichenicoccus roseus TaxID=2683649 RepID=UPI001486FD1C|nr:hypothetical protein [Lichenicoccus roseus]